MPWRPPPEAPGRGRPEAPVADAAGAPVADAAAGAPEPGKGARAAKALTLGEMVARGLVARPAPASSLAGGRRVVVADLLDGGAIRHGAATYASPTAFATAVIGKSVRKGLKAVT
ncbi:hypothetical protein SO694_00059214 [Aureococcus anophagefferens]|uniref:Uncharacterized protein n=1 Tax=Aureococcus anophagefferens TaxID=44056 RepID=A0ABR1FYV3_AURAN